MTMLVTGVAGFIGSHLAERLLADGHGVRGVDSFTPYYDPAIKRANLRGALTHDRFELREVDLRTGDLASLMDGVDVVFHQAAQPGVRSSWADGFAVYNAHNVLVTQRLLEACVERPIRRFVYASSSSVYGNVDAYPCDERTLPRPHSPYGVTKLAAEHLCSAYAHNHGVPTTMLRYFTVYGPRQRPDMAFTRLIEATLHGEAFPLYGDGTQTRDFTFVDDVVDANVAAAAVAVAPGEVCNVAGGSSASVAEIVDLVERLTGRRVVIDRRPRRAGDVDRTAGATARAARVLGWRPRVDLESGLARQVAAARAIELAG